jgi:CubicO group peptidase (beta-lactamase class C family)
MIYHTSGLRDYLNLFPLAGRGDYYPISHAQILAMMVRQRALIFPPGDQYRYSNTAYMLLAPTCCWRRFSSAPGANRWAR